MTITLSTPSSEQERYIDWVFANRASKEIVLSPGVYYTKGVWHHGDNWEQVISPDTKIRVNNGAAVISLAPDASPVFKGVTRPTKDLQVLSGQDFEMCGVSIDGNQANFASAGYVVTSGLRWRGGAKITACEVSGLRGSYASKQEAFGLSCHGSYGHSELQNVAVVNCAENAYVSGINAGYVTVNGLETSASFTLTKATLRPGAGNWMGLGVNCNINASEVHIDGVRTAIYNDTDKTSRVRLKQLDARNIESGIRLIRPPGGIGSKGDIRVSASSFSFIGDAGGIARLVELWDQSVSAPVVMGPVLIEDSRVTTLSSVTQFYKWSVVANASNYRPVLLVNMEYEVAAPRLVNGPGFEMV